MQVSEDSERKLLIRKHIKIVIEKFSMQDSKPSSKTPTKDNFMLFKATEDEQVVEETLYRSLVGYLLYIAKQSRPNKVWVINVLSRFMERPANSHWLAGKLVLR